MRALAQRGVDELRERKRRASNRLMDHILARVPQRLEVIRRERVDQHRRAGDVEDGVGHGDLLGERRAGLRGERLELGDEQNRLHPLGELDRLRHPLSHPAEPGVDAHLEPAVDGGRDVVGVALRVRGELKEELLGLGRGEILTRERQPGGEAGDERRRGGTEAARGRDAVDGGELDVVDGEGLVGEDGGVPVANGGDDGVGFVAGEGVLALAVDVHLEGTALQDELVLEVDRETERVETGAHVRGRRGDGNAARWGKAGGSADG